MQWLPQKLVDKLGFDPEKTAQEVQKKQQGEEQKIVVKRGKRGPYKKRKFSREPKDNMFGIKYDFVIKKFENEPNCGATRKELALQWFNRDSFQDQVNVSLIICKVNSLLRKSRAGWGITGRGRKGYHVVHGGRDAPDLRQNHHAKEGNTLQVRRGEDQKRLLERKAKEVGLHQSQLLSMIIDDFFKRNPKVTIGFIQ